MHIDYAKPFFTLVTSYIIIKWKTNVSHGGPTSQLQDNPFHVPQH